MQIPTFFDFFLSQVLECLRGPKSLNKSNGVLSCWQASFVITIGGIGLIFILVIAPH